MDGNQLGLGIDEEAKQKLVMKNRTRHRSPRNVFLVLVFLFLFLSCQAHSQDIGVKCNGSRTHSRTVTLGWDANTEPDLAGYKIYYKTGAPGPPYDGTGAAEGSSPLRIPLEGLNNPDHPQFRIHDLCATDTYFFAVTAYDADRNESGYSNEVHYSPRGEKNK